MTAALVSTYPVRLVRAVKAATAFLQEHNVTSLPIDPEQLIRKCGWDLMRYSYILENSPEPITLSNLIRQLNSPDAVTICTNERVLILYNDTGRTQERIRFTLCHEIGHLILEHFVDFNIGTLSPDEKAALEVEANVFAACLMAPVGVMQLLREPLVDSYRHIFGMSLQSWRLRLDSLKQEGAMLKDSEIKQQQTAFYNFMYGRECMACSHDFASSTTLFCTKCGSRGVRWKHAIPDPNRSRYSRISMISTFMPGAPVPRIAPYPAAEKEFTWTPSEWSEFTFMCMAEADRAIKNRPEGDIPLGHEFLDENPMVIDELWEPRKRRTKQNGKRRTSSSHC